MYNTTCIPDDLLCSVRVRAVPGYSVCLPDNQRSRPNLVDLSQHQLKLWTVIRSTRQSRLRVLLDNREPMVFRILLSLLTLLVNTGIVLSMRTVSVIGYRKVIVVLNELLLFFA